MERTFFFLVFLPSMLRAGGAQANSVTAQRPLHQTVGYDSLSPLPLFRTALIPIAFHSRFVCAGIPFSEWAIGISGNIEIYTIFVTI
jgi:hypothetical protein